MGRIRSRLCNKSACEVGASKLHLWFCFALTGGFHLLLFPLLVLLLDGHKSCPIRRVGRDGWRGRGQGSSKAIIALLPPPPLVVVVVVDQSGRDAELIISRQGAPHSQSSPPTYKPSATPTILPSSPTHTCCILIQVTGVFTQLEQSTS